MSIQDLDLPGDPTMSNVVERFGSIFPPRLHVFRMIATFVARMSQRARNAGATVFPVHALHGVSHPLEHAHGTYET
jgi:hypothetical protein